MALSPPLPRHLREADDAGLQGQGDVQVPHRRMPWPAQPHLQRDLRVPGGALPAVRGVAGAHCVLPPEQHEAQGEAGLGLLGPQQYQRGAAGPLDGDERCRRSAGLPLAHTHRHIGVCQRVCVRVGASTAGLHCRVVPLIRLPDLPKAGRRFANVQAWLASFRRRQTMKQSTEGWMQRRMEAYCFQISLSLSEICMCNYCLQVYITTTPRPPNKKVNNNQTNIWVRHWASGPKNSSPGWTGIFYPGFHQQKTSFLLQPWMATKRLLPRCPTHYPRTCCSRAYRVTLYTLAFTGTTRCRFLFELDLVEIKPSDVFPSDSFKHFSQL